MKKLQVVSPTAVSPPALAVAAVLLLLLLLTFRRPSFLAMYEYDDPTIAVTAVARRVPSDCDIFRGDWVPDDVAGGDAAPYYYTNATCAVIQEHQNCIKYGRPDLGFLRWRWRPSRCELPRFDAPAFLHLVAGKSLAFVGD